MESVTEVPEEASRLHQPRFWIRVFLLLDRLPAKANEPCLPPPTHRHTHNRFTALCILSGTTRVSWYQKKHSPTHTYRGHQSSLICFLHLIQSCCKINPNPNTNLNSNRIITCIPVNLTLAVNPNVNPNANPNLNDWMQDAFVAVNATTMKIFNRKPNLTLTPNNSIEIDYRSGKLGLHRCHWYFHQP